MCQEKRDSETHTALPQEAVIQWWQTGEMQVTARRKAVWWGVQSWGTSLCRVREGDLEEADIWWEGGMWECQTHQVKSSVFVAQSWARAKVVKQSFATVALLILWLGDPLLDGLPVHCWMCTSIPDLSVLDARRASNWDNPERFALWAKSFPTKKHCLRRTQWYILLCQNWKRKISLWFHKIPLKRQAMW